MREARKKNQVVKKKGGTHVEMAKNSSSGERSR
jgi:hypothetical protein